MANYSNFKVLTRMAQMLSNGVSISDYTQVGYSFEQLAPIRLACRETLMKLLEYLYVDKKMVVTQYELEHLVDLIWDFFRIQTQYKDGLMQKYLIQVRTDTTPRLTEIVCDWVKMMPEFRFVEMTNLQFVSPESMKEPNM